MVRQKWLGLFWDLVTFNKNDNNNNDDYNNNNNNNSYHFLQLSYYFYELVNIFAI